LWLFALLTLAGTAVGQTANSTLATTAPQAQPPPTTAAAFDREISGIENQVLEAAEAMPEDKFNFSPESVNIPVDKLQGCAHVCGAGQAWRQTVELKWSDPKSKTTPEPVWRPSPSAHPPKSAEGGATMVGSCGDKRWARPPRIRNTWIIGVVESHPNVAENATLGWGTRQNPLNA
jgi:hypothetical protein